MSDAPKDPSILFVRPGAVNAAGKKALSDAGVVLIEIDDPASVKFVRASAEIATSDILAAALKGVKGSNYSEAAFAKALIEIYLAQWEGH